MFFRLIRLTSPNLNYIIVAGALCFYASVYFLLWPPNVPKDTVKGFCNVRTACFVCMYVCLYMYACIKNWIYQSLFHIFQVSLWLAIIAFSLSFGTINAKMWRVYLICHKPKPTMKKTVSF